MACLWALVVISAISVTRALLFSDHPTASIYLSVSMSSPGNGVASLYYDIGKGFNDSHVASAPLREHRQVTDYLFQIPNKTLYSLRWDPPQITDGIISVHKIEILDGFRKPLKHLQLTQLEPLHQIQSFAVSDTKVAIQVQEGADDPQIKINLETPLIAKRLAPALRFVGGVLLELIGLFLIACLLIAIWLRQRNKVIATAIVISIVFFGWRCWSQYGDATSLFLQVAMRSSVTSTAQVYYDTGWGLNEKQSQQLQIIRGEDVRRYRFRLPNEKIFDLRFDPAMAGGKVWIGEIGVTDAYGSLLRAIPLEHLAPINQIRTINYGKVVEIDIPEDANDPQVSIPLKDPLLFEKALPFPTARWLVTLLKELVFTILVAFAFVWAWKRWQNPVIRNLESAFVQEKLPVAYLGTALGLILAMGLVSGLDVHPDEWNGHIKAAAYYLQNWLPPAVDDPRILNSISVFGISYLWHVDPFYFLAVKGTQALSGIVPDFYVRMRLANAILFLLLIVIVARRVKSAQWIIPLLILTPQLWYVFSYFNNDAFPLFLSALLALQITDPESSLKRFLAAPVIRGNLLRGILPGILIGLLLSSKLNYRIFIAFLIFVALWRIRFEIKDVQRTREMKRWLFLFSVALLLYLPLYGYDQYVNDFNKDEKIVTVMERHAGPQFKPSTMQNHLTETYKGLRLKDKGVTLYELLIQNPDWRNTTFKSLFGIYGYMDIVSSGDYYRAVTYALGLLFLLAFFCAAFTLTGRDMIFFLFVLIFAGLVVGQSVYHSWINDYQPQGRYLFPILPMFMVALARMPSSYRMRIMPLFVLVFFLLSVWSFLLTGLRMIPKIN